MWQKIANVASVLAILGVSANSFAGKAFEAHIALGVIVLTCIVCLVHVFWRIYKWQKLSYPRGFRPISTFVRYSTVDGNIITHESFKTVQIKRTFMSGTDHRYRWSGSKSPQISSLIQEIGETSLDTESGFSVLKLKFRSIRFYNDVEVMHLKSVMDDSDGEGETYLSAIITLPLTMLHLRVELLHCLDAKHVGMMAKVVRSKSSLKEPDFHRIADVAFDLNSHSFEHIVMNPEPGYDYRLVWEKPEPVKKKAAGRGAQRGRKPAGAHNKSSPSLAPTQ